MNVSQITNTINSFFTKINSKINKVPVIPAILLICACKSRPGLSALKSLSNICLALENLGISTKSNPDGSPNLVVAVSYAITKEIYRAMNEDAVAQGAVESGNVQIMSKGANSGGPVVSSGSNILPFSLRALIH